MERINKGNTFWKFTLLRNEKRKKFSNRLRLGVAFYSWNIPLCSEKERIN